MIETKNISSKQTFANAHFLRQRRLEKEFAPKFYNIIRKQIIVFLNSIKTNGYEYSRNNIFQIIPMTGIAETIKSLYTKAAYIESNYVLQDLKRKRKQREKFRTTPGFALSLDDLAPLIDQYFKIRLIQDAAIPISETTRDYITRHLINQVDSGVPLADAITAFRELALTGTPRSPSYSEKRARTIARSETTKSLSFGGLIGAYMSGIDVERVWVTSDDERVRTGKYRNQFSHVKLDNNVASLFQNFNNGEDIKFPGDPDSSLGNQINCRCSVFFREKPRPKRPIGRLITQFLTDFFIGFTIGIETTSQLLND